MSGVFETSFPTWIWALGWTLTAVAVIGNGVVIYLIASRERLQTNTNAFILSLAVADMCVGLSLFPILTVREYQHTSEARNRRLFWLSWFFLYASAENICVMATDRFMAINSPLKYAIRMTRRRVGMLIAVAWLVPFSTVLPMAFVDTNEESGKEAEKILVTLYFFLFELLSCIVLVVATSRILFIVRKQRRETAAILNQVRFNQRDPSVIVTSTRPIPSRTERSAVKVLIALVILFVICYIFAMCCSFCVVFDLCGPCNVLGNSRFLFLITNSAGNPLAYAFFKRDIRAELVRKIPCCKVNTSNSINNNSRSRSRVISRDRFSSFRT